MNRNYKNYKAEYFYREIVDSSLRIIQDVKKTHFANVLIGEALRINVLRPSHLEGFKVEEYRGDYFQKEQLKYLLDRTHTTQISNLSTRNLKNYLYNSNSSKFI